MSAPDLLEHRPFRQQQCPTELASDRALARLRRTMLGLGIAGVALGALAVGTFSRATAHRVFESQGLVLSRVVAQRLESLEQPERAAAIAAITQLAPSSADYSIEVESRETGRPPREVSTIRGSVLGGLELNTVVPLGRSEELVVVSRGEEVRRRGFMLAVVAALVGFGLMLALCRLAARQLLLPITAKIQRLLGGIARISDGDLDFRFSPHPLRDEFDLVASRIDEMSDAIRGLQRQRESVFRMQLDLSARLAHDVNTPVSVIRGYAENLLDSDRGATAQGRQQAYGEILGQARYVEAIVEDLVALGVKETKGLELRWEHFPLDDLLDEIADGFELFARARGINLRADGAGIHIWADRLRVRQVVTNLVRNAFDHAVAATHVEVLATQSTQDSTIVVQDNGLPSQVSQCPGWGLGGQIAEMLVALHGGTVRREARVPGFVVTIRLPRWQS